MFTYITVGGTGRWVTSDYDANSYAYLRQYFETANSELPLIMSHTTTTSGDDSYKTAYGGVVAGVTLNPSTKTISATAFKENGTALADKYVAKVSGKGLSTNDYTTAEKNKLNGLSNYTLPTATSSVLGGVKTGSNITNSSGTISISKSNVTNALGYTPASPTDVENKADVYTVAKKLSDVKVGDNLSGVTLVFDTSKTTDYVHPYDNFTITFANGQQIMCRWGMSTGVEYGIYDGNPYGMVSPYFAQSSTWNLGEYTLNSTSNWTVTSISYTNQMDTPTPIENLPCVSVTTYGSSADCESNYKELQKKANTYRLSNIVFNGLSSSIQNFPNNYNNKHIIGVIDDGNTGFITSDAASYNTQIYYSNDLNNMELTTLLYESGHTNNIGFVINGNSIAWDDTKLSNTYWDSTTITAFKNAFGVIEGTVVDCEYNYKNKSNIYKATNTVPLEVGMDMNGKKLIINTDAEMDTHFNPPFPSVFIKFSSGSEIYTSTSGMMGIIFSDMTNQQSVVLNSDFSKNGWNYSEYTLPQGVGTITSIASSTGGSMYSSVSDTFTTGDNVVADCEYNYKEIQALKTGSGVGGGLYLHSLEIDTGSTYFMYLDVYTSSANQISTSNDLYTIVGTREHPATYSGNDGYGAVTFQMINAGLCNVIGMLYKSGAYMNVGYVNISGATIYGVTDIVKKV